MKGEQYIYEKNDLFIAVIALRYLLPFKSFLSFKKKLLKCINYYLKKTDCINHSELYRFMDFLSWSDRNTSCITILIFFSTQTTIRIEFILA